MVVGIDADVAGDLERFADDGFGVHIGVVVEGVNMLTKHNKVSAQNPNGGIVHIEGAIDISNVMYLKNGKPTRVGFEVRDGKKVRIAKADGSVID